MIEDIKRILKSCKRINVRNCDPWPEKDYTKGPIYLVGLTNSDWPGETDQFKCYEIYYPKYCKRIGKNDLTYGGYKYLRKDGEGDFWWTFNYVYDDRYNKEYAYIVNNEDDGDKLAKFLTSIYGYFDINKINEKISDINKNIEELNKEIQYYEDIKKYIDENK